MLKGSLRYAILKFVAESDKRDPSGWVEIRPFLEELWKREKVHASEYGAARKYLYNEKRWVRFIPEEFTQIVANGEGQQEEQLVDGPINAYMYDSGWEEWARFKKESDATVRANWSLGVAIAAAAIALFGVMLKSCNPESHSSSSCGSEHGASCVHSQHGHH